MPNQKITRALARKLAQSKGAPVSVAVYVAVESDKLTLSSFAARAAQRNQVVRDLFAKVMARVQEWEASSGESVSVSFRPDDAALVIAARPSLLDLLAEDKAVAAIDVEAA